MRLSEQIGQLKAKLSAKQSELNDERDRLKVANAEIQTLQRRIAYFEGALEGVPRRQILASNGSGIDLRDHFAGIALAALAADKEYRNDDGDPPAALVAFHAYALADAMIDTRAQVCAGCGKTRAHCDARGALPELRLPAPYAEEASRGEEGAVRCLTARR